ncbi:ABC transporter substrate-binding protein [candidate division CSSED10-310 bacterium]|uniref:ABC transporter substrate-binding protein n=1 Tax=candidate division CSSED10-310 bacterium TaxID=2855610 RepID=A0ABV6Z199_UNCC1
MLDRTASTMTIKNRCIFRGISVIMIATVMFNCGTTKVPKKELTDFQSGINTVEDEEKLKFVAKYIASHPTSSIKDELLFIQGQILLESNKSEEALHIFSQLTQHYPLSRRLFEAEFGKAQALNNLDKAGEARMTITSLLKKINVLTRGLQRKDKHLITNKKSINHQLAITKTPDFIIKVRLLYADLLIIEKKYQDALFQLRLLTRGATKKTDRPGLDNEINYKKAVCYHAILEIDQALELLAKNIIRVERSKVSELKNIRSFLLIGTILRSIGNPLRAIDYYLQALQLQITDEDRLTLTTNIETTINENLKEPELVALFHQHKGSYPSNRAVFKLLQYYDHHQLNAEAIKFAQEALPFTTSEDEKLKVQAYLDRLLIKTSVDRSCLSFIGPLSGEFAPLGREIVRGARLAIAEYNQNISLISRKVHLIEEDSAGDPTRIADVVERLVKTEKTMAIIGPVLSKTVEAIAAETQEYQIVAFTPSTTESSIPALSNYIFRNSITNEQQIKALVDYAMDKKACKRFAIFYPMTRYGDALQKLFIDYVSIRGGRLLVSKSYPHNTNDFSGLLTPYKDIPIEALFIPDYANRVAQIAPQLAFHDIFPGIILGTNMLNSNDLIQLGGKYVENIIFTDDFFLESNSFILKDFIELYHGTFGLIPTRYAAQSFDTTKIILSLLNQGVQTRESLRQKLGELTQFNGVTGVLAIDHTGEVKRTVRILTVHKGLIIQLE